MRRFVITSASIGPTVTETPTHGVPSWAKRLYVVEAEFSGGDGGFRPDSIRIETMDSDLFVSICELLNVDHNDGTAQWVKDSLSKNRIDQGATP